MEICRYMVLAAGITLTISCGNKQNWTEISKGQYNLVVQEGGATLGYSPSSGIELLYEDGFAFKDHNRNGNLDIYEDWRQSARKRAENLASCMTIDEIAGLMLYSEHQAVPTDDSGYWASTYEGKSLSESGLPHSALTDRQKDFLKNDNLRAILVVRVESPAIAAEWNNNLQCFCEGLGKGIPVNISSDPRNEAEAWAEFNAGSGGDISLWPCQLGLAATFDPETVRQFGEIASREYRAMGIATALSPQADLGTEPRWLRFYGTFGESPELATDMIKAYIDGFQTSTGETEICDGWGYCSVNTMVKHWPGGGTGESGRDAHYSFGKYSVYPGNNFNQQLDPFIKGAFNLEGGTGMASAVMPYYTISYGIDPSGRNVGNSYSRYIVNDLLRNRYGYDGVVCTDWGVTHNYYDVNKAEGKCWGCENMTEAERHYEILKAGVDQFGGNNDAGPVLDAYRMWVEDAGEKSARERFEESAVRLLLNMFRTGLFENPYSDPEEADRIVGCPEFMDAGYKAQLKSVIMLKNRGRTLPQTGKKKIYFPMRHIAPEKGFFGQVTDGDYWEYPMDTIMVGEYYDITDKPDEADFAFVYISEPSGPYGYDEADVLSGGNGYIPVSLQYEDYTADYARKPSIAGGDPYENFTDRSYRGKTVRAYNKSDLKLVRDTKAVMGDRPVIVAVAALRPFVPAEIEPYADALLVGINVQHQAILDIISGNYEPQGLLPMQLPASMKTVEEQYEDMPFDMECYTDSEGNSYDFAFGMDWNGVIYDARVRKYAL